MEALQVFVLGKVCWNKGNCRLSVVLKKIFSKLFEVNFVNVIGVGTEVEFHADNMESSEDDLVENTDG